jgi:hypothetical protein
VELPSALALSGGEGEASSVLRQLSPPARARCALLVAGDEASLMVVLVDVVNSDSGGGIGPVTPDGRHGLALRPIPISLRRKA